MKFDLTTILAIWGAFLASVLALKEFALLWRNRQRIQFRSLVADCYFEKWSQVDIDNLGPAPGPPDAKYHITSEDIKRAFIVLEFVVKNHYSEAMMIGRFQIDEWMFAKKYTPEMYGPRRDYQVFDLYTHKPTSLADYKYVEPNGSFGLRVEILDEVHETFSSMRSRKVIELPTSYIIEFQTDAGIQKYEVEINKAGQMFYNNFQVHRWGDLLEPLKPSTQGAPRPQSVRTPSLSHSRFEKIRQRLGL